MRGVLELLLLSKLLDEVIGLAQRLLMILVDVAGLTAVLPPLYKLFLRLIFKFGVYLLLHGPLPFFRSLRADARLWGPR